MSEFQKYPSDKKKFDKNWVRIFGERCPECLGTGVVDDTKHSVELGIDIDKECPRCNGVGKVEKKK